MAKEIIVVVSPDGFRDEELFVPKRVFENLGFIVRVASMTHTARGYPSGKTISTDVTTDDIGDGDALVVVGGPGTRKLANDYDLAGAIRRFNAAGKLVCAICLAPTLLADAGVLDGKHATVWPSTEAIHHLEKNGVLYDPDHVVVDGNIVTADGPSASQAFAERIASLLR